MSEPRQENAAILADPTLLLKSIGLVRRGKVYRLSHVLAPSIPQLMDSPAAHSVRRMSIDVRHTDLPQHGTRVFSEWIALESHSGTHIDGFSHWATNDLMRGGVNWDEVYTPTGMTQLGLDETLPLLTRGVLIDAAASAGVQILPPGTALQPDDLAAALDRQGVSLQPGDVALVRTGWANNWGDPRVYMDQYPGLSRRAAEWIADRGCVALGADQSLIDPVPPERIEDRRACHEVCLVERGVYIIENLNLEELSRERCYEFFFIAAAALRGGTGFPIQALAIV